MAEPKPLQGKVLGFVGLGKIGSGMVANLVAAGAEVVAYDRDVKARDSISEAGATVTSSTADVGKHSRIVFSAVPDDRVLNAVAEELLPALAANSREGARAVHVSCSTVAPKTSKALAAEHQQAGVGFVAAPVFARPDGMRRGEATIPVSGPSWAKELVVPALWTTASGVIDFGEDPGAANVVKLGGNFLIAAAIQSMAEATALAESHGVDREEFIKVMSSTIFDCLIYRGYGHRVAARDHFPYPDAHFALDLGSKDVSLVHQAAVDARCPMPVASVIRDRFVASQNKGLGRLDWSALALGVSQDAGANVDERLSELLTSLKKADA